MLHYTHNNTSILDKVLFSNEVWIHLLGYVNSRSYCVWFTANPHKFQEKSLHPEKIGMVSHITKTCNQTSVFGANNHIRVVSGVGVQQFIALLELGKHDIASSRMLCWRVLPE